MITAVIVLYHPNSSHLLDRLLQSVRGQIDKLIVVDNSPVPDDSSNSILKAYRGDAQYIKLGENRGIASAHNVGILQAIKCGASHVLLLDQDSLVPTGMVATLLAAEQSLVNSGYRVAGVGPVIIDEKTGDASKAIRHRRLSIRKIPIDQRSDEPVETDYLIASGSLIRLTVLEELGTMRDALFIDWVDVEWGLRLRRSGYKCYIVPKAVMFHSIGDSTVRAVGRDINLHNDTRNYYIVRNATYLLRLKTMGWSWRLITLFKIPQYVVFYSWHSSNPWKSLVLLSGAITHGFRGKLGPIV